MRRMSKLSLFVVICLLLFGRVTPTLAQENQPQTLSPDLTLFTQYPAQEIAIGDTVTINLTLRSDDQSQIVRLEVRDLPEDWLASFRGGGRIIQSAYVEPENPTLVDLRIEPAANVEAGSYTFEVLAQSDSGQVTLPLELIVKDQLPPSMTLDIDLPTLRGAPDTTFRFNATLQNEGDADLDVNLLADAPRGLLADFKLNGQSVTSIPLAANETKNLSIEVQVFPEMPAGAYEIDVVARGGEAEATTTLIADVIGDSRVEVNAPDGRLSEQISAGQTTPITLILSNTGTSPAQNITLSAAPPTGWTVEFEPAQIAEIAGGETVNVTANIQPSNQAIAGDYVVNITAQPEEGRSDTAEFRITVMTSTLWGIVGVVLIAIAVFGVGLAVMRFGRR